MISIRDIWDYRNSQVGSLCYVEPSDQDSLADAKWIYQKLNGKRRFEADVYSLDDTPDENNSSQEALDAYRRAIGLLSGRPKMAIDGLKINDF